MSVLFVLAVSIGLLAVADSRLFFGPLAAFQKQVWQGFGPGQDRGLHVV